MSPRNRRAKVRRYLPDEIRNRVGRTGPFDHVEIWFDGWMLHASVRTARRGQTDLGNGWVLMSGGMHCAWVPQPAPPKDRA